jgi:tryptophan synthase alpha chain
MTEISNVFMELKHRKEAALIAYVTIGDPHVDETSRLVNALIEGGADIIELGIPFSDPIADGPMIQNAVSRSLHGGCRPLDVINIARTIRDRYDNPLVVMSYYNPIFRIGVSRFLRAARAAHISGLIVPDLPIEESQSYKKECVANDMDTIYLASPSTDEERLKQITTETTGYLYLVSLYGVTGIRTTISKAALDLVRKCDNSMPDDLPFAVGFGISKPSHVRKLVQTGADGVIVGSAFVKIIAEGNNTTRTARKLTALASKLKRDTKLT